MDAPQEEFYPESDRKGLMVVFRIISCHSWDEMQNWHRALPGSRIEHLMYGIYVMTVEPGGAWSLES